MAKRLELRFITANGGARTLRVPDPDPDLSAGVITSAALIIIDNDIFVSTTGPMVSLSRADLVTVINTELL